MTDIEMLKTMKNLRWLARFMNLGWGIPFTKIRFCAESIFGLLPGGGDVINMMVGLFIVAKAHEMGASRQIIFKMLGNVAIDAGVGAVPIVGDIFDTLFMSNVRNIDLLAEFLKQKGYAV